MGKQLPSRRQDKNRKMLQYEGCFKELMIIYMCFSWLKTTSGVGVLGGGGVARAQRSQCLV